MSRAPRVLVLGSVLAQPPGGVRRHACEVLPRAASLLRAGGGHLAVLTGAHGLPFELGPDVELIAGELPSGSPLRRWLVEGRRVRRVLRAATEPFDVVHTGHLPLPRGLPTAHTRLVWLVHDLRRAHAELVGGIRASFGRRHYASAALRANRIVTVSRHTARELATIAPVARTKTSIAPNGADHLDPLPRAAEPDVLLAVGHLERRKNPELLLRTLALDPDLPPLLLAGRDVGGVRTRLEALAVRLGVANRVRIHGAFDDRELPDLYARAACVVVPSHLEGFGLVVAEAQRAGAPVACARAGSLSEVAGPFATSFDPGSPQECAHAIRMALARPASELEAARRHSARFRWDRSAERLVRAWERDPPTDDAGS